MYQEAKGSIPEKLDAYQQRCGNFILSSNCVLLLCKAHWLLYEYVSPAEYLEILRLCGSQNKQLLFPHTSLTDRFL
jgi:hypothetical protein